jgi:sugar phosphate permease
MAAATVPPPVDDPNQRVVPARIMDKYRAWKWWAGVWNAVHYVSGAGAAALSALIAANVKARPSFLTDTQVLWVAVAAAICSFVLTTLNPQKTAQGFIAAYRHLEKAMSRYYSNPAPNLVDLGKAEQEGIDKLT